VSVYEPSLFYFHIKDFLEAAAAAAVVKATVEVMKATVEFAS
jgi:hypothetical protein